MWYLILLVYGDDDDDGDGDAWLALVLAYTRQPLAQIKKSGGKGAELCQTHYVVLVILCDEQMHRACGAAECSRRDDAQIYLQYMARYSCTDTEPLVLNLFSLSLGLNMRDRVVPCCPAGPAPESTRRPSVSPRPNRELVRYVWSCLALNGGGEQEKRAFAERRDCLLLLREQKEYQRMTSNIQRCEVAGVHRRRGGGWPSARNKSSLLAVLSLGLSCLSLVGGRNDCMAFCFGSASLEANIKTSFGVRVVFDCRNLLDTRHEVRARPEHLLISAA